MDIYFYNTLTKQKDLFKPIEEGKVKIYSCGPTVYKDATIGNMRTNLLNDTLRRVLKYNGYELKHEYYRCRTFSIRWRRRRRQNVKIC
jgi:cysteinyl-tRNA synthetase